MSGQPRSTTIQRSWITITFVDQGAAASDRPVDIATAVTVPPPGIVNANRERPGENG